MSEYTFEAPGRIIEEREDGIHVVPACKPRISLPKGFVVKYNISYTDRALSGWEVVCLHKDEVKQAWDLDDKHLEPRDLEEPIEFCGYYLRTVPQIFTVVLYEKEVIMTLKKEYWEKINKPHAHVELDDYIIMLHGIEKYRPVPKAEGITFYEKKEEEVAKK